MTTALPLQRLTAADFLDAAAATLFFLVRVEVGRPALHPGVARFFADQYPGLFGFGLLPLHETRVPGWWEHAFRSAVGPVRGDRTGYWLFHEARVVGHHSGVIRADVVFTHAETVVEDATRGRVEAEWVRKVAFEGKRVTARELTAALELIAYFDGIVVERQTRSGFGDGATRAARPGVARVTPQVVPIPGESGDPFDVLKVPSTATDEEIRAAYKRQMKLHHPDKLAHMSPEIRAYAEAWTRVIRAAYTALAVSDPPRPPKGKEEDP